MNAVLVGCSNRKAAAPRGLPALELYQGGCVPAMRAYADAGRRGRCGVFVLSARHGLVGADDVIHPYDQALDLATAKRLRPAVGAALTGELTRLGADELVIVAEPLYLVLIADVLATQGHPAVHWFADPAVDFAAAAVVLDRWGWQ